jgi:lipopolysaccharide export system permease protein
MRARLMARYVLGEMIPMFFLGVIIFVAILLMFQLLRLTDFVLIHGVKLSAVGLMMAYMSTSFLPILFPMSLLFTVLLTYSRLSADSEIVAFRASGLSMISILSPALILSILIAFLSIQTSYYMAPWGNRQFEVLFTKIGSMKPAMILKEGTFSEGFFDLVVYANKVDSKKGKLTGVFIYDERNPAVPLTVIAREGLLVMDSGQGGHNAMLRLIDGSMHRTSEGRHTKIDFQNWKIYLSDPVTEQFRNKTPRSLTIEELHQKLASSDLKPEDRIALEAETQGRVAISFACVMFAMLGVGLGTVNNRRSAKGGGMVLSLGLIVVYWIFYITTEGMARKGTLPPQIAMWIPNAVFSIAAIWALRRSWY